MSERIKSVLYPLVAIALLLAAWGVATGVYGVPNYILPQLGQLWTALVRGFVRGDIYRHLAFTLGCALAGYGLGAVVGVVLGALTAEIRAVERVVQPLVVGFQSMPKVALAPLLVVWFGFGALGKIVLIALVCFFPVFVNVVSGMRAVDRNLVDMMRSFGVSRLGVFRQVKLPAMLPPLFAGLEIAVVLALIGAVVGEFISANQGLGYMIQTGSAGLDLGVVFIAIFTLAALGSLGTALLRQVQGRVVFWQRAAGPSTAAET